jgi:hypothetical protein
MMSNHKKEKKYGYNGLPLNHPLPKGKAKYLSINNKERIEAEKKRR